MCFHGNLTNAEPWSPATATLLCGFRQSCNLLKHLGNSSIRIAFDYHILLSTIPGTFRDPFLLNCYQFQEQEKSLDARFGKYGAWGGSEMLFLANNFLSKSVYCCNQWHEFCQDSQNLRQNHLSCFI